MQPVRHEHTIGTAIIITAVFLVSFGLAASSVHAESTTAGKPKPAVVTKPQEPAVLKKIIAAHWRLANARAALPAVQLVHKETLEIQDWVEHAFDGGALRLYVSPGNRDDIFAILVDTREPRYGSFAKLTSTQGYAVYHHYAYTAVLPLRPVPQKLFDTLKAKEWTENELEEQLGAPSYHWHVHGVGWSGLTFVPQGLEFIGNHTSHSQDIYQVFTSEWEKQHENSLELPPLEFLSQLDYAKLQREDRAGFAGRLVGQRQEIEHALESGAQSADGRFAVGDVYLAAWGHEVVIRERNKPEQRYLYAINAELSFRFLNDRTILMKTKVWGYDSFSTMDALTGTETPIAETQYQGPADLPDPSPDHEVTDFGVSGPDRFWYKAQDGQTHEVTVPNMKPHGSH